jgi:hypothetical protein
MAVDGANEISEVVNPEVEMTDDNALAGDDGAKGEVNGAADATTASNDTLMEEKRSAVEGEA